MNTENKEKQHEDKNIIERNKQVNKVLPGMNIIFNLIMVMKMIFNIIMKMII